MAESQWATLSKAETERDELADDDSDDDYVEDPEADPNIFRIRKPLPKPSTVTYQAKGLHRLIHQGFVDLDAPYQRGVVWPEKKQIHLIDSLFRNFHIPPIVFAVTMDELGDTVRVCVDGKQRLTSIQKFIDGEIYHYDKQTKKKWFYIMPPSSKKGLQIPDNKKKEFDDKQITCIEYQDLREESEREIFQRVQLGMALTAAENLAAIQSPWTTWMADIVRRYVTADDGIASKVKFDTARGKDFQLVGLLIMVVYHSPNLCDVTSQKLEKFVNNPDPPEKSFITHVQSIFSMMVDLVSDDRFRYPFTTWAKLAPVEFIYIGALLSKIGDFGEQHDDAALAKVAAAIHGMRIHVRGKHADIRTNSKVSKTLHEFIQSTKAVGSQVEKDWGTDSDEGKRRKRRKIGMSGDDDDYRPGREEKKVPGRGTGKRR